MTDLTSDEIQRRLHEALEKTEVLPATILPDNTIDLRPHSKKQASSRRSATTSSSLTSESPNSRPTSASFLAKNWKLLAFGLALCAVSLFLYRKWTLIRKLGVGYGIGSVPGLSKVGAHISGIDEERLQDEVDALEKGSHPGVQRDILPTDLQRRNNKVKKERSEPVEAVAATATAEVDFEAAAEVTEAEAEAETEIAASDSEVFEAE